MSQQDNPKSFTDYWIDGLGSQIEKRAWRKGLDSEDTAQQVFTNLYAKYGNFGVGKPENLAVRALNNLATEVYRRNGRRPPQIEIPESLPADESLSPQTIVLERERNGILYQALASLSENQRLAIGMQMEGFSNQESADILGTTVGALKSRLRLGKDNLRKYLEKAGFKY